MAYCYILVTEEAFNKTKQSASNDVKTLINGFLLNETGTFIGKKVVYFGFCTDRNGWDVEYEGDWDYDKEEEVLNELKELLQKNGDVIFMTQG